MPDAKTIGLSLLFRQLAVAVIVGSLLLLQGCAATGGKGLRTKNVIIVVIDGVRASETWDSIPGAIPNMATNLKSKGVFFSDFQNDAYTYTNAGHTAITTGVNQPIDNYGAELPAHPSIFQQWLKQTGKPTTAAWIISSKDKLNILANTKDTVWQNTYMPSLNCGINGPGTGYRADSLTFEVVKQVLTTNKPNLVLINFMEPDGYAHAANWNYYLRGIKRDDSYVQQLYDFLKKDKNYRKNTALLVTTDHGRHLQGIDGGWIDHGDDCPGCRKIFLLALGPDFKTGTVTSKHTLVDISATVAKMLGFTFEQSQGQVMKELFPAKKLRAMGL
ncbi:sulfatase-like hydrolase/transferase [Pontibacter sp. BT213]|uniref:Sulfatase-like hydrolase/transferase n=2 Tax=Pontibacter fetidus TaxID=2700082 RepID=A0A6B2GZ16_9BACT|nr:sulfatase-like hydrolase/transferase [Pontibacter fetidus]